MIWFIACGGLLGFTFGMRLRLFGLMASVFLLAVAFAAIAAATGFAPLIAAVAGAVTFQLSAFAAMSVRVVLARHDGAGIVAAESAPRPASWSESRPPRRI